MSCPHGYAFSNVFANVTEGRNDGNELEAIGIMTLTIASRIHGLDHQSASQFLGRIAVQFNANYLELGHVTFSNDAVSSFLDGVEIPFSFIRLSKPDDNSIVHKGFGYFWRTQDGRV